MAGSPIESDTLNARESNLKLAYGKGPLETVVFFLFSKYVLTISWNGIRFETVQSNTQTKQIMQITNLSLPFPVAMAEPDRRKQARRERHIPVFTSESRLMDWMGDSGFSIRCYHGGQGISFTSCNGSKVWIATRDAGKWTVRRFIVPIE
jgi:hypothetical protein